MSKLLILALCLSLVAMGLACANAPQASIDEGKNALEAAREAGAEEYAPEAWQGAQDALTSAMTEVEAQNERVCLAPVVRCGCAAPRRSAAGREHSRHRR